MTRHSAKDKILDILKRCGSRGATTWELISETHHSRAAGRVWELIEEDGHRIDKREEGRGIVRWIYRGHPEPPTQQRLL